jgi:hypothetical protein
VLVPLLAALALRQSSSGNEHRCLVKPVFTEHFHRRHSYGDLGEHYCRNAQGNREAQYRAGNAILGAAIIDDILGIVALTVITSLRTRA